MIHRNKAMFFDRDGVLNIDTGYIAYRSQFVWVDKAIDALRYSRARGYLNLVVTNQSGIARGFYSEEDVMSLHSWMNEQAGGLIDRFYFCPYHPEGKIKRYVVLDHFDRKPNPGMILRGISEFELAPSNCLLIGDKLTDIEAAKRAGVRGYQFGGGNLLEFVKSLI